MRVLALVFVFSFAINGSAQSSFGARPAFSSAGDLTKTPLPSLPPTDRTVPITGDSVTLRQLAARPSARAIRETQKAARFATRGQHAKAVILLERAVQDSPAYYEAHNNLGVEYDRLNRTREAEAEFGRLIELDPDCAVGYANLGVLVYNTGRYRDSERMARQAVQRQAGYDLGQFLLAMSLLQQNRGLPEARRLLLAASHSIPEASSALQVLDAKALKSNR